MYPYMNEDVAFERLKDLQQEMENSRLNAGTLAGVGRLVRNLSARAWWLGGLAMPLRTPPNLGPWGRRAASAPRPARRRGRPRRRAPRG